MEHLEEEERHEGEKPSLLSLPEPVLCTIVSQLPAEALARIECTSSALRLYATPEAWFRALTCLVGGSTAHSTSLASLCGSAKRACESARHLCRSTLAQIHRLSVLACASLQQPEHLMDALFKLELELLERPKQRNSELVRRCFDAVEQIAHDDPESLLSFAESLLSKCVAYAPDDGFYMWPSVPWQRSALQFTIELLSLRSERAVEVAVRLRERSTDIDDAIHSATEEAIALVQAPPRYLPIHHCQWWNPSAPSQVGAIDPLC